LSGLEALNAAVKRDIEMIALPTATWVKSLTHPSGRHVYDVAIVGGGQSGLGAAFALRREGVPNVVILDENEPGKEGPWITYARMLTLRTPKHLTGVETGIPSLTFRSWFESQHGAAAWGQVERIARGDWMDYLRWFRDVLDLPVRNGVRVTGIKKTGGLFELAVAGGESVLARKVVLATGIQGGGEWHVPPNIREALPKSMYAHTSGPVDYEALKGKRIGILGSGASAFDNANHALAIGAAETHVFARREELQRINPIRHMERAGMIKGYGMLSDAEKYGALTHFLKLSQPPTNDTFKRSKAQSGFHLHMGSPWTAVRKEGDQAVVTTPKGEHRFDYLIVSTGTITDLGLRPELAAFLPDIALWRDRDVGSGKRNPEIDVHPYLGYGFEMQGRDAASNARVHGLFMFNYSALASLGMSAAAISGLRFALPRLAEGVVKQIFLDDRHEILCEYYAFADAEFTADRD
jgi:cation diffusion facilitator CzcD-associated flavoprotein CzcO